MTFLCKGCFDVHEHDVLLQGAHQPHGMRQMSVFSSLRYKQMDATDEARIEHYIKTYKFAGLAVTPYTPRLGSEGFQQGQGFVATFTGLNVVRVAEDVICGDILVAVPPLNDHINKLRDVIGTCLVCLYPKPKTLTCTPGKHTSPTMLVVPVRWLCKQKYRDTTGEKRLADIEGLKGFVVGRCVGGARRGQMATVVLGPYDYECK